MSSSESDEGQVSDNAGPSNAEPTARTRPKRSAPRKSVVESESSGEDEAVRLATTKAKRPKKSRKSESPLDAIFQDVDREKMGTMNELEREMNVYKHMEEMEIKKQREELLRTLKNKDKTGAKKAGKSAKAMDSDEESEEGKYSSSSESEGEIRESKRAPKPKSSDGEDEGPDMAYHRPSEVDEKRKKQSAMGALLSKRKEKKEAEEKRKEQDKNRAVLDIDEIFGGVGGKSSSSSTTSSSSSRSSSVSSRSSRSRSPSPESQKEIENLADLNKVKASRSLLARFVHLPFFSKLANGCYVRIGIGQYEGKPVYRIAKIVDVVETAKVYTVENTRTNKGVKLQHGGDIRVYRLEFLSNQAFTDKEWLQWLQAMRSKNLPLPSVNEIAEKAKQLEEFKLYTFTSNDIDYMIKEKQRFLHTPTNYAIEKSRLMKEKADAEEQGNHARAKEIQHEIDELDQRADQTEHQRQGKLAAVALINKKRRDDMKQNFLDPKKVNWETTAQDDPFTRKHNRTKGVSSVAKKTKDEESQQQDPTTGGGPSQQTMVQASKTVITTTTIKVPSTANGNTDASSSTVTTTTTKQKFTSKLANPAKPAQVSKQFAHLDIDLDI